MKRKIRECTLRACSEAVTGRIGNLKENEKALTGIVVRDTTKRTSPHCGRRTTTDNESLSTARPK